MGPDLVINDLSFVPSPDTYTAHKHMTGLIGVLRSAIDAGANRHLRTTHEFYSAKLTAAYHLYDWLDDDEVSLEERKYLKTLQLMAPPLGHLPEKQEEMNRSEYRFNGQVADALGSAYLIDGLAVSLLTAPCWDAPDLTLTRSHLTDTGDIAPETSVEVHHASRTEHIQTHSAWIHSFIKSQVTSGTALWERRHDLFPSLDFCDKSKYRFLVLGNDKYLRQIKQHLDELEQFCEKLRADPSLPFPGSPDSEATLDKYPKERTYLCSDGQDRLFSQHLKMIDGWRLYFHKHTELGKLYIGPIGPHLRTVKYPS